MSSSIDRIFEKHKAVIEGEVAPKGAPRYRRYAVSNLRGGVGKSSIAFNIAYELSRVRPLLVADLCPQCNLTESLMRGTVPEVTINDVLRPKILGSAFGEAPEEISYHLGEVRSSFKFGKPSYIIPGSAELFAFPSALYQQLQLATVAGGPATVGRLLHSLRDILVEHAKAMKCDVMLMDTSPFFSGGTHLAWCAAEALIIPVRVDEHSVESLRLTFNMLAQEHRDFMMWNNRANITTGPRVAAIVMTMVGAKGKERALPDSASRMFIERALKIAEEHSEFFDFEDPADAFVITDDFMSSGRVSGAKSIPISKLETGSFHTVDGKRLQVNSSVERYQKELRHLASII